MKPILSRHFLFPLLFLVACSSLLAQSAERPARFNRLYIELGGAAAGISGNYERVIIPHLSLRAGFGGVSTWFDIDSGKSEKLTISTTPILVNAIGLFDTGLEVGVGVTIFYFPNGRQVSSQSTLSASKVKAVASIGYSLESEGGIIGRLAFTPFFDSEGFHPWGGASVGFAF